jgi:membrane associated rhomboid family serine protease
MEDNYRKRMSLGQDGNALVQLILLNAVLFVILLFIYIFYELNNTPAVIYDMKIVPWVSLPVSFEKLSSRPWTVLTFMFADDKNNIFRFIGNIFWLSGFGYILQDLTGNRKLIPIYLYGGLAAALCFLLANWAFPGLHAIGAGAVEAARAAGAAGVAGAGLLGANPSIMALAIATTTAAPDYRIFPMINGGIRLWILTLFYVIINFYSIHFGDGSVYIANFAGGLAGWLFIFFLRKGYDGSIWINHLFDWFNNLFNPAGKKHTKSPKDQFYYKVSGTQPFKKIPNITQQRIDEILDKINQQGYRFLTDEEKEILKRAADEEDL